MTSPLPHPEPAGPAQAVANAHQWFDHHSGWAPPDVDTLAEWVADGVCRCPDECLVEPDHWCTHGLASWALILAALDAPNERATPGTSERIRSGDVSGRSRSGGT